MSDTSATSLISLIRHIADMDIQMAGADSQVIHIDPPHTDERVGHIRPVLPLSDYSFFKLNTEISNVFIQAGYCVPTWCIELPKMSGPDFTLCIKDIFDLNTGTWQNIKQCSDQLFNLLEQMSLISLIRVQQVGIFVNLIVSDTYIQQVLNHILDTDDRYGSCDILLGQSAIVEYSSPNMGKQMGIGHLRSTIIGQIIANTMMALGSRILKRNYLGDRGTPFGKLIYSLIYHYQIEGSQLVDQIITAPTEMMLRLYASFSTLPAEDKLEKAKLYFMRLEQGCDPVVKLWHILRSATLVDFQYIYDQFQISFDITHGESFTQQYLSEIENDLTQAGGGGKGRM